MLSDTLLRTFKDIQLDIQFFKLKVASKAK
jgi:hypothetical protein